MGPSLISGSGKDISVPQLATEYGTEIQRTEIANWLARWKIDQRKSLPVIYETSPPSASGSSSDDVEEEDGDEVFTPFGGVEKAAISNLEQSITNPLASVLPEEDDTEFYIVLPIFNLNDQPMFIVLASFDKKVSVEQESLLFVENAAMVIRSSILRQQIGAAEQAAQYFVSQVQVSK